MPDQFSLNWIRDQYAGVLEEEAKAIGPVQLELGLGPPGPPSEPVAAQSELPIRAVMIEAASEMPAGPRLNDRYTFGSFVTGPSNELAWRAAKTVADSATAIYNPLVLVGGVGLGKTHLLHAIAHVLSKRKPSVRLQIKTSEDFINDVVQGIRVEQMEKVRATYRACDVLLIDDIQFISRKPACQEEFFHTFNALHNAQKQIVVSSDRFPGQIPEIEDRIRSRFAWGLIADLRLPDLETRIAILRKKADADGITIGDEVAEFLAQSVRSNMRELEGCLIRVHAYSSLKGVPISIELAQEVLQGVISDRARVLTPETIIKTVCTYFDVKPADIKSSGRGPAIAYPRQIAMYLCRKHTDCSYPAIGAALGGKDHTTALNAFTRITARMVTEPKVKHDVEAVERELLD